MNKVMNNEKGFTLIEVIAVLIIIGILAAVAVPRYFDVSDEAKKKAYESAISNGMSLCSLSYGKAALSANGQPALADVFKALAGDSSFGAATFDVVPDLTGTGTSLPSGFTPSSTTSDVKLSIQGDFTYSFSTDTSNSGIKIEVKPIKWTFNATDTLNDRTGLWKMPTP